MFKHQDKTTMQKILQTSTKKQITKGHVFGIKDLETVTIFF